MVEMPICLGHLQRRFEGAGGVLQERRCHSIQEALERAPRVINCTGLGSRELMGDERLVPVRGTPAEG